MIFNSKIGGFNFLIAFIFLFASSCTEKIDLYTSHNVLPVVYCLLNPDDSIQYVRVGQTFASINDDSLIIDFNHSYLQDEFEVYITCETEDNETELFWFSDHEGASRDSGFFELEDLQLLSANMPVKTNAVYKLYVDLQNSEMLVFGEIRSFERKLQVIDPLDVPNRTINLFTGRDFYFRFAPVSKKAVYQAIFTFKFDEFINGIPDRQSIDFQIDMAYGEAYDVDFVDKRFSGEIFLKEVGRKLKPKDGVTRVPVGAGFHLSAGGEELYYLIKSENSQSGFSAVSQSNLLNAVGIFSTLSHKFINNIKFSRFTIDSLADSQYTHDLGFVPFSKLEQ